VNTISELKVKKFAASLFMLGLFIMSAGLGHVGLADGGFPTPPPAPRAPEPVILTEMVPADHPLSLGGILWEVQPRAQGTIPSIPPLRSDTYETPGYLKVTIEAGTLLETIQLAYSRTPPENTLRPHPFQNLVEVFDLTAYNGKGQKTNPTFRRPWILEVSVGDLRSVSVDPSRLLFARFENGRWLPMVTNYFWQGNVLVARITGTGRFAIIEESPPV
jgi:hypothetical protein